MNLDGETEQLLDELKRGSHAYSDATYRFIKDFMFAGLSLHEWAERMHVEIPDDPDPRDMQRLFVELTRKTQTAGHYLSVANSIAVALDESGDLKKSQLVTEVIKKYEEQKMKRPAMKGIDRLAEEQMRSLINQQIAGKIAKTFWRQRYDALDKMRKNLKEAAMMSAVEIKHLGEGP